MATIDNKATINIDGATLSLEKLTSIATGAPLTIPLQAKNRIDQSEALVRKIAKGGTPTYGINTGFGFFANRHISPKELEDLQVNLVKSHAAGFGTPLSPEETRLAMVLRLNVFVKGMTGVRYKLCQALLNLIQSGILPVIPEMGSVGASGDLAPLAHLALPLLGLGHVHFRGAIVPAKEALKACGLKPFKLGIKEGLGLINGTQVMLAVGGLALARATPLSRAFDKVAALTYEAFVANVDALDPRIHQARPHPGQLRAAAFIRKELESSYLFDKGTVRRRIQDPYSLRCAPQVHGAARDALEYAGRVVNIELNSATDNPLVFVDEEKILSGGNFHGQPIAMAFDIAAMALADLCSISERRLEQLLNPVLSGLPAFLTPFEGLHSGYMAAQYLSASIVNENKLLATPASTDSIPGNVGVEDHVSMGMTAARKLKRIVHNARAVLAVELLASAQAVDLRGIKRLGKGTSKTYKALRAVVPMLEGDRIVAEDVAKAVEVIDEI